MPYSAGRMSVRAGEEVIVGLLNENGADVYLLEPKTDSIQEGVSAWSRGGSPNEPGKLPCVHY